MNTIIGFLTGHIVWLIGALAVILCIILISILNKNRKHRNEVRESAIRAKREENLDQAIMNPRTNAQEMRDQGAYGPRPYQVNYNDGTGRASGAKQNASGKSGKNVPMMEITQNSAYVARKFLFERSESLLLSQKYGQMTILQSIEEADSTPYCEIFFYKGKNYARSSGQSKVVITRHNKAREIDRQGLELQNGDIISVQNNSFIVRFF